MASNNNIFIAKATIMNANEYIKLAQQCGEHIPVSLRLDRYGEIDQDTVNNGGMPLIEHLLDSGSLTIIIKNDKVPQNLLSIILAKILSQGIDVLPNHWHYMHKTPAICQIFIDIERQRQYLKKLTQRQVPLRANAL